MKVLITTDLYATATNGVVTSVRNLQTELAKMGHDVRVLTLSDTRKTYRDGVIYYVKSIPLGFVYPNLRMPISYRNALTCELIRWKPDVIHSQCECFSFQFARHISKATGAPIVHTYHTLYEQYISYLIPGKRLGKYLVRILSRKRLKKVKVVIAPTAKVETVLKNYGLAMPIRVIPSGISLEQHYIRISEEERHIRRELLGIPSDHNVILNLGRLGTEKNLEELLELFAKAVVSNARLTFLIVGDGPSKAMLQGLSEKLGIQERVVFTGMVEPSEVQKYYQLGDVFVSASTSETQGLTYIEAAANGLPLLCRQDPCLDSVIENGVNGYTYSAPEEFLRDMDRLMQNPLLRIDMGKQSERMAASFDKRQFAVNVDAIYKSVVS